jgi:hypothetical protein
MANKHPLPMPAAARVRPGEPINHPHTSIPKPPTKLIQIAKEINKNTDHYGGDGLKWYEIVGIPDPTQQ